MLTAAIQTCHRALLAATAFSIVSSSTAFGIPTSHQAQHRIPPKHGAFRTKVIKPSSIPLSRPTCLSVLSDWRFWLFAPHSVLCQSHAGTEPFTWENEPKDSNPNSYYYYQKMDLPSRASLDSHVIYGQLLQTGCIERYHVYQRINSLGQDDSPELIVADVHFGHFLNGHEGVVHGGILAMLFDDSMGMAFGAMGVPMALTANLNVDYRKPVLADSKVLIRVQLVRREGRKLFFDARMTSHDGAILYAEATSLYVIPKQQHVQ